MHYSKLLLVALPFVAAAPLSTITHVVTETFTVTISANGQVFTQLASSIETEVVAVPTDNALVGQVDQALSQPSIPAPPVVTDPPVAPIAVTTPIAAPSSSDPPSAAPSPSDTPAVAANGASGCPIDPSAPISPGINGAAGKSVHESTNYIRRLYNPNAKCLGWSPSLASSSLSCAQDGTESNLRANSNIVSDNGGYGKSDPWFNGPQATTQFESSMFTLLCQSPNDPQLQVNGQSGCAGKVGEIDCAGGACTGHHDALVDAAGAFSFTGVGLSPGNGWASTSFSASCQIFDLTCGN